MLSSLFTVPDEKPAIESQNTTEECISFKFKHPDKFNAANASYKSKVGCQHCKGTIYDNNYAVENDKSKK